MTYLFFYILELLLKFLDVGIAVIPTSIVHKGSLLVRNGSNGPSSETTRDATTNRPSAKELLTGHGSGGMVCIDWTAASGGQADLIV